MIYLIMYAREEKNNTMIKLLKSDFRYVVGIIFIGLYILINRVVTYRKNIDVMYLCFVFITFIRFIILKIKNRKLYQ